MTEREEFLAWLYRDFHASASQIAVEWMFDAWQARAALSVFADDDDADAYVIATMGKLLADVALVLKGPQEELKRHSYDDLPDLVRALQCEVELYRAEETGCADGGKDSSGAEELVRYCPGCGSIGPVEAKYRDCCPDGSDARMVPEKFAEQCRDTFKLAIAAIAKEHK